MKFQRAHTSIIKSVRQVALVRDWLHWRGAHALPHIADFEPSERAGDAADLFVCAVEHGVKRRFFCQTAGERVRQATDHVMNACFLDECLESSIVSVAQPVWDACMDHKLPIYSIVPTSDRDGCPVTLEQLYLPFSTDHAKADVMVASLHAFSTEGRYVLRGLLRQNSRVAPLYWAVVIDPSMTAGGVRQPSAAILEIDDRASA